MDLKEEKIKDIKLAIDKITKLPLYCSHGNDIFFNIKLNQNIKDYECIQQGSSNFYELNFGSFIISASDRYDRLNDFFLDTVFCIVVPNFRDFIAETGIDISKFSFEDLLQKHTTLSNFFNNFPLEFM